MQTTIEINRGASPKLKIGQYFSYDERVFRIIQGESTFENVEILIIDERNAIVITRFTVSEKIADSGILGDYIESLLRPIYGIIRNIVVIHDITIKHKL